ncbi:MAG: PQQ-binding-like beta-propeller repeat protein [Vulcanimicrobiaceae bacterium]
MLTFVTAVLYWKTPPNQPPPTYPAWNATFGILPSQTTADDEHSPPTIANGVVYEADGPNDTVYALNAMTGELLWTSAGTTNEALYTPPVADRNLYLASYEGTVYAFGLPDRLLPASASHLAKPRLPLRWSLRMHLLGR